MKEESPNRTWRDLSWLFDFGWIKRTEEMEDKIKGTTLQASTTATHLSQVIKVMS